MSNYLITGGSKGVGRELYNQLVQNGHVVYICDIEQPTWKIKKNLFTKIDCSLDDKIKKLSKDFLKKKILFDGLIFCHGAHHTAPLLNTEIKDLKKVFEINFFSYFYLIKNLYSLMINGGKIISISSIAATTPIPYSFVYSSSKSSLESMFFCFFNEFKKKKMNLVVVQPGNINTGFNETGNKFSNRNSKSYKFYIKVVKKIHSKYGMKPENVAIKIANILKKKNPLPRYVIGKNAILANLGLRGLGLFLTLRLLRVFFKL